MFRPSHANAFFFNHITYKCFFHDKLQLSNNVETESILKEHKLHVIRNISETIR